MRASEVAQGRDGPLAGSKPVATGAERRTALRHIAAIPDGNRRWAQQRGLSTLDAYRAAGAKAHEFLDWCDAAGIAVITLWPLSHDNLRRDPAELSGVFSVITQTLDELADSRRWRVNLIGDLTALPPESAIAMRAAAARTSTFTGPVVNMAIAYSGRQEILRAVRAILTEHAAAGTPRDLATTLSVEDVASHLDTAGQPDPDLIIRTSGERRVSDFMLWQAAYTEYHFSPVPWPDLSHADFRDALDTYRGRQRRFGL